jgi:hypothetical protein
VRSGRAALLGAAGMAAAAAMQQAMTVRDRRRYPAPGALVNVDGHPMHLLTENASFEVVQGASHESLISKREHARVVAKAVVAVAAAARDRGTPN